MPSFYSLDAIAHVQPWQVGELALLLHQLQQAGKPVAPSWVIPAAAFEQTLQKLVAREPILADWPRLLWQTSHLQGIPGQQLARRLRQPLLHSPLNWPLQPLLAQLQTVSVRLIPSLWFGSGIASADFAQMLGSSVCWAQEGALEMALKHLWAEMFRARSLAYWSRWQASGSHPYPSDVGIAVVVQALEPAQASGTLTVRADSLTLEVVSGLPQAIAQAYPDTYQGPIAANGSLPWQVGYQEYDYQPAAVTGATADWKTCLIPTPTTTPGRNRLSPETIAALLAWAAWLQQWMAAPGRIEWLLPRGHSPLHIVQAHRWPLVQRQVRPQERASQSQQLVGHAAAPGTTVGSALVIQPGDRLPASAEQRVLIATEVAPDWLPLLKTAVAVVSEKGGLTCHAAVLARELGLPAVVGVAEATCRIRSGETVRVDGDHGLVEQLSTAPVGPPFPSSGLPQLPVLDTPLQLWLNLSQPERAAIAATLPVAGVGLLRSEWLMMPILEQVHPYEWLRRGQAALLKDCLLSQLRPILQAFAPRPVRYRSLDIRSNEFSQLQGAPAVETNPMLGVRGAFSYQQYPQFFQLELEVLRQLQLEGYTHLQLLLPFVRTVEEVQFCRRSIDQAALTRVPEFQLWIMAEVPSSLFLLPQYQAVGVQGIAIGTHDLTQLLLGIDRDQALFSCQFDAAHPAVQAAIAQLVQQAHSLGIDCLLCGVSSAQLSADWLRTLIHQGLTGLSSDLAALEGIGHRLQQLVAHPP